jgi:hypothetical protein
MTDTTILSYMVGEEETLRNHYQSHAEFKHGISKKVVTPRESRYTLVEHE